MKTRHRWKRRTNISRYWDCTKEGCGAFFLNLTASNMRPLPRKPFPWPCPFAPGQTKGPR